jgi:glutaminase
MSCAALARPFLFLANNGVVPASGERILSVSETKRFNAIMLTCGFIVAVIPGELSIAVWSPELDSHGNSLIGIKVLELFTSRTGLSIF